MTTPKKILVPTDFGEPSDAALATAIEYARVFGAEIVLMHAFEIPIVGFPDGAMVATADLTERILEGARMALDRRIDEQRDAGVVIRGMIKQGDASATVTGAADEIHADLIVLGTHGRKGLSRALLGSVAERVVRTARVPVLTVHPTSMPKEERPRDEAPASAASR